MKTSQQIWHITVCPRLVSILSLGIAFITIISFCSNFEFAMSFRTAAAAGKMLIAPKYNSQMKIDEINNFDRSVTGYDFALKTITPDARRLGNETGIKASLKDQPQTYIITNENACSSVHDLFIIVIVHSAIHNFERRKFIRNTWGNANRRGMPDENKFRIVFLLGKPDNNQHQLKINVENEQYSDIVQGTFLDTYKNLTYKALLGLRWIMENCKQAHFVLKVDDDVIINTPRLVTILSNKYAQVNQTIFCAEVRPKGTARIYRQGKYKVENTQFTNMTFWPVTFCPGRYLIYSADIIIDLLAEVNQTPFIWLDDVYVTGLLAAKVGHVNHLKANDINILVRWLENASINRMLSTWNSFGNE